MTEKRVSTERQATPAMLRALAAVTKGLIARAAGDVFTAPAGVSMQTIRDLRYRGWISDGAELSAAPATSVPLILTSQGRIQLVAAEYRRTHREKDGIAPIHRIQGGPIQVSAVASGRQRSAVDRERDANRPPGRPAGNGLGDRGRTNLRHPHAGRTADAANEPRGTSPAARQVADDATNWSLPL